MRSVRWRVSARAQLRALVDYVSDRDPIVTERLRVNFEERILRLGDWPEIGRPGRVGGTREFVLHPNYVEVCEVLPDYVMVLRILHARQRYP